jgi:hypothetical protein
MSIRVIEKTQAKTMPQIDLYQSSNGDCWFLCKNEAGNVYVVHEPNRASGGKASTMEVVTFLSQQHGPQHRALMDLIGSLVDQKR